MLLINRFFMQRLFRKHEKTIATPAPPSGTASITFTGSGTVSIKGQYGYTVDGSYYWNSAPVSNIYAKSSFAVFGNDVTEFSCTGGVLSNLTLTSTTKLTTLNLYNSSCTTFSYNSTNLRNLHTFVADTTTAASTSKLNTLLSSLPSRVSKAWGSITIYSSSIMASIESSYMAKDWYFGSTLLYSAPDKIPQAIKDLGIPRFWESARYGAGRRIGVLDSCFDSNLTNITYSNVTILGNFADYTGQVADDVGVYHGNKIASCLVGNGTIYYGVCPQAKLYIGRIAPKGQSSATFQAITNGLTSLYSSPSNPYVDTINYSYSSAASSTTANYYNWGHLLEILTDNRNTIMCCGSGNEGNINTVDYFPKCSTDALSIGASTTDSSLASYSEGHLGLDFVARTNIAVEYKAGVKGNLNGTSGATPMFNGMYCLMKNILYYKNGTTPTIQQVLDALKRRTYQLNIDVKKEGYGNVSFNAYRATIPTVPQS